LSFEATGTGKPVVLLHGVGASKKVWEPLVKKLDPNKWRVIAVDLLGFGKSPRPDWSPYDVKEHSKSVRATLRRLRIKEPITLVGHSMGCLVAANVATRWPKSVERMVLYEPPLFADSVEFSKHKSMRDRYFKVFEYVLTHPSMLLTQKRLLRLARKLYGMQMSQEDWLPFERSLRNTIMQQHLYNDLKGIKIPTDIIYGRLDFVVTRAQVAAMFETQANIRLHIVNRMHSVSARAAVFIARLLA
jgi:cis-3-alkyl-4-acyloxetan-2-one decarboxylase